MTVYVSYVGAVSRQATIKAAKAAAALTVGTRLDYCNNLLLVQQSGNSTAYSEHRIPWHVSSYMLHCW